MLNLELLQAVQCRQCHHTKTRMVLACWPLNGIHVGPCLRKLHAVKSWGSARSCHMDPIHFQLPKRQIDQCWASMSVLPFLPHVGYQLNVQHAVKKVYHPGELPWGSASSSHRASIPFRLPNIALYRVLSTCTCQAQSCCCRRWRGQPSWWAGQSSAHCRPPPRSSPPRAAISSPTSRLLCAKSPVPCCTHRQSV